MQSCVNMERFELWSMCTFHNKHVEFMHGLACEFLHMVEETIEVKVAQVSHVLVEEFVETERRS